MKCCRIPQALALALCLVPVMAANATVENVGAGGGGWLYASAFSRTNSQEMVIGTDMNGVLRSTNDGLLWKPFNAGLISTDPEHKISSYVQDLCSVDYNGWTGYFAATSGGIFSENGSGTWTDETPLSSFWQDWDNYNEYPTSYLYHHVGEAIPFSCLEWVVGTPLVVAGCGHNRWSGYVGEHVPDSSNGWTGYPGCDALTQQPPYPEPAYNSYLVGSSFGQTQYSVFVRDLDGPASWTPLNGATVTCEFGAARDVAAAVVGGVTYVAVSTNSGIYLYDYSVGDWIDLTDILPVAINGTVDQGPWYGYGSGLRLAGWSLHLTARGTLYAAMERTTADELTLASGVYCLRDISNLAGAQWQWVANNQQIIYGVGGIPSVPAQTMQAAGLLNYNDGGTMRPRTHFIYLGVGEGVGVAPDILFLGDRLSAAYGMLRAGVDPALDLNQVQWTSLAYRNGSNFYNVDLSGVAQPFDTGWETLWGLNVISKPAVDPASAGRVLVQFNGRLHLADDGFTFLNRYCQPAGSGWLTTGYTETCVKDIAFHTDGRMIESNGDVGILRGLNAEHSAWEHVATGSSVGNETGAVTVMPYWNNTSSDATIVVAGEWAAYKGTSQVMFQHASVNGGAWIDIAPEFVSANLHIWDLAVVSDTVLFAAYTNMYGTEGSVTTWGVRRGVYDGSTWTWTEVFDQALTGPIDDLLYVAASSRLYAAGRLIVPPSPSPPVPGRVIYLQNPATGTTWTNLLDASCGSTSFGEMAYKKGKFFVATRFPTQLLYSANINLAPSQFTYQAMGLPAGVDASMVRISSLAPSIWDELAVYAGFDAGYSIMSGVFKCAPAPTPTWSSVDLAEWQGMGISKVKFNPLATKKGQLAVGTDGFETLVTFIPDPTPPPPPPPNISGALERGTFVARDDGSVVLAFSAATTSEIEVQIYDLRGRRMRTVADRTFPAGSNEVVWDGRDGNGRRCASGVYLVRLDSEGASVTGKVVLTR